MTDINTAPNIVALDPEKTVQPPLHINDIGTSRNIIKVALERGTFKDPKESKEVWEVYERLDTFVKYAAGVELFAKQKKEKEAAAITQTENKTVEVTAKKKSTQTKVAKKAKKS